MEEFKQLEIYLFPIVMLLTIGMNNWKREERTQGDRVFGFLPFLIICMMGSDVAYHALQLYVHRFTVLYAGYLVYCFFLTAGMPCYDGNCYRCGAAYSDHSLELEHGGMGCACGIL